MKYELRQIDAWGNDQDGYEWNASYRIAETTIRNETKKNASSAFRRLGVISRRGKTRVYYDGDIYELQDRKTGEPLYALIPLEY